MNVSGYLEGDSAADKKNYGKNCSILLNHKF